MNLSLPFESQIESDLDQIEGLLQKGVRSQVYLADFLSQRLVQLGGKRLRPLLMCLTYHTVQSSKEKPFPRATHSQLHTLASVGEWVHTATLFHDDVLDHSTARRGEPCAHIIEGNKVAILVGDYVYAEAFALLMEQGLLEPSKSLAFTIKALVEGELLQHKQTLERDIELKTYERIAQAKTASLFGWCCKTGAWAAGSEKFEQAGEFGLQLGFAFQMADDLLDTFELDVHNANEGDLREWAVSAPPLPIVYTAQKESLIQKLWKELPGKMNNLEDLKQNIFFLQRSSAHTDHLKNMQEKIETTLNKASALLEDFGHNQFLGQAVDLIRSRAQEGYNKALRFQ